jgi:hypothetical protein
MKKILLTIIITFGFMHAEDWIYFNYVPMDCYWFSCWPVYESVHRIKPDGSENETILENVQFIDLSEDQSTFLLINGLIDNNYNNEMLQIYNIETMDTININFEPFIQIRQARFIQDDNMILISGIGETGKELYSYSTSDSSITMIADSLSSYFDNMEMSPDEQQVLYFKESLIQPEGVSGCDLPENTLYLTDLEGGAGDYTGEVFYNSTADIGQFQFVYMGPPTGSTATGGDAGNAGFTIEYPSLSSVMGSSTGLAIPAGCGTLTNITRNNSAGGLNNIVMFDSEGETLEFNYYDGYLNTDDYIMNFDVITEDIQTGETSILATIPQLISVINNRPYWSDNGFIYLFFFDNNECMQLFKIHSTDGSITQLTDNPCSSHCPAAFLETNQTDLEQLVYAAYNDILHDEEYWIYDIDTNESSYLGYFGYENYYLTLLSQTWSLDRSKVAFNETFNHALSGFSGPLRVYDTVTDSIAILEAFNGWGAVSPIVWVTDTLAGDVNGDSLLNVQDIVIIVNMILSGEANSSADYNGDGDVNILDIVAIVQVIVGN